MNRRKPANAPALTAVLRARAKAFFWLGALLLAINLLAAAALPPRPAVAAEIPGAIEICTPEGMAWIDADGHRITPQGQPAQKVECQFCLPLLHGAFGLAALPAIPAPAQLVLPAFDPVPPARAPPARVRHPAQPRAPPSV